MAAQTQPWLSHGTQTPSPVLLWAAFYHLKPDHVFIEHLLHEMPFTGLGCLLLPRDSPLAYSFAQGGLITSLSSHRPSVTK